MVHVISILHALPIPLVRKALPLHTRDIKHVRLSKDLLQALTLMHRHAGFPCSGYDARGHCEFGRRDEVEAHGVEAEQRYE
jgi:hypothetical protein